MVFVLTSLYTIGLAGAAPGNCSCAARTLAGSYAGTVSGHNTSGVPVAYQAIAHFDGAGHFDLSGFTYVQDGAVLVSNASATGGTYQINPDCSGSIQISTTGGTFRFAILITGKKASQFQMLETDGTATTSGNAVMQSLEPKDPR
jgi:hypothetical protein